MAENPGTAQLPGEAQGNLMNGYKNLKEGLEKCILGCFQWCPRGREDKVKCRGFCLIITLL